MEIFKQNLILFVIGELFLEEGRAWVGQLLVLGATLQRIETEEALTGLVGLEDHISRLVDVN